MVNTKTFPAKRGRKGVRSMVLRGSNFLSDWFFVWAWSLVTLCRSTDLKRIKLYLDDSEKSRRNAELICRNWEKERKMNPEYAPLPLSLLPFRIRN